MLNYNIKEYIKKYFTNYLHNRIGTLLTRNEKEIVNILNRPILKPGKLIINQTRYDEYEWVLYKNIDLTNPHLHWIYYKDNNNNIIEKSIRAFNLIGYSETNNILPDNTYLINFDEKNLIEKYNLDN